MLRAEERNEVALPCVPPLQKAVQLFLLPGKERHLKWWLMKFFADQVDIVHMYSKMGNDACSEMQL
jgi:hypothetical protein